MEDRNQFQTIAPDAVRNDVRSARHDEFAGPEQASRSAHLWLGYQKVDGTENLRGDMGCTLFRILRNEFSKRNEVTDRPSRPNNLHRGALVSPRFPQVF